MPHNRPHPGDPGFEEFLEEQELRAGFALKKPKVPKVSADATEGLPQVPRFTATGQRLITGRQDDLFKDRPSFRDVRRPLVEPPFERRDVPFETPEELSVLFAERVAEQGPAPGREPFALSEFDLPTTDEEAALFLASRPKELQGFFLVREGEAAGKVKGPDNEDAPPDIAEAVRARVTRESIAMDMLANNARIRVEEIKDLGRLAVRNAADTATAERLEAQALDDVATAEALAQSLEDQIALSATFQASLQFTLQTMADLKADKDRILRQKEIDVSEGNLTETTRANKALERAETRRLELDKERVRLDTLELKLNLLMTLSSAPHLIKFLANSGLLQNMFGDLGLDFSALSGQGFSFNLQDLSQMSEGERREALFNESARTGIPVQDILSALQRQAPGGVSGRPTRRTR